MEEILYALIPLVAIVTFGLVKIGRGPIGLALARRIGGETGAAGESAAELADLRIQVDALRGELSEMHERLDFAERLLAQRRDAAQLEGQV